MRKPKNDILYEEGRFYHVYNRGHHKMKVFRSEDDYSHFIHLIYKTLRNYHIMLICYCLMPNHFHMMLKLGEDKTHISKFFQRLLTAYCCYFNRRYRLVGSVFQGRFQARQIENRKDYISTMGYIKRNPSEAGLVKEGEDYRWQHVRKGWNRLKV